MKFLFSQIAYVFRSQKERNLRILSKYFLVLLLLIALYSVIFHFIMLYEGKEFSWITGIYWTLTVMSTLGFGDITFTSDLGKLFSIFVLMSGIIFLLIILPFTFIQFFYAPWLEAQNKAKAPRELPRNTSDHVILTNFDSLTSNLVERLERFGYQYVILLADLQGALEIHDLGYRVVVGEPGDPQTYGLLRAERAALVVANSGDMMNTNIAFTVRQVSQEVPIVANADLVDSVDILELSGATYVFQFMRLLGESLARRTLGSSTRSNVIGSVDSLLLVEAPAMRTPLEGRTLGQSRLREESGVTVVGLWESGVFALPTADTMITSATVLILAGSSEQLDRYDDRFTSQQKSEFPVLILGGGRVGRAAGETLEDQGIGYRIIEKNKNLIQPSERFILGSGADINTLIRAGIREAPSIIITTHDDRTNIYLTIYCRRLRPDIQIICRANLDRNISKLHKAGADLVMSYVSMATSTIVNLLNPSDLQMLAEGLNVFRITVPVRLKNKTLSQSRMRQKTGCNLIALSRNGRMTINPDPQYRFQENDELVLIGTDEAQQKFFQAFSARV